MRFRLFRSWFDRLFADQATTHELLRNLQAQGTSIMSQLDDLKAQVAANRAVSQSAVALINGIADRIAAAPAPISRRSRSW